MLITTSKGNWRKQRENVNGGFLLVLYEETQKLRSERSFRKLSEMLTENDFRDICNSSREFREGFKLR
jgi:hypothetical protein